MTVYVYEYSSEILKSHQRLRNLTNKAMSVCIVIVCFIQRTFIVSKVSVRYFPLTKRR